MTALLALGLAMVFGLIFNRIAKKLYLPNVTGYLLAGILIGPFILNILSVEMLPQLNIIVEVALGFVAFSIGGEFKLSYIKKIGTSVLAITCFEAVGATIITTIGLLALGFDISIALTLGAIAAATAPAATLMVVRQYKAKGPVTDILLPVVAMDDAVALFLFSIFFSIAKVLASGAEMSWLSMILTPLKEIGLSLGVGAVLGFLLSFTLRFFNSRANRICLIICSVILGTALADILGGSSLLLCMATAAIMANTFPQYEKILEINDSWTPPIFLLFFVISGAEIDFSVVPTVGLLGIAYLVLRSCGKYFGAGIGSTLTKRESTIRKYLGIALLPQAGVAIGMSQIVTAEFPQYGAQIRAVVLMATLIYELVGPILTRMALTRAGEIVPPDKKTSSQTT